MDNPETSRRRRRLSADDKWQIFIEASAKDAKVADVLRRWRIDSSQQVRIRTQVKGRRTHPAQEGTGEKPQGPREESLKGRDGSPRGRIQRSLDREQAARF